MIPSRHSSLISTSSLFPLTNKSTYQKLVYIKNRKYLYLTVCAGNLLAICVGFAFSWSSPALLIMTDEQFLDNNPVGRIITSEEASWIGSLLSLGGIFGVFIAIFTSSTCGRKASLILSCVVPFLIGYGITGFANTVYLFSIARFIIGIGVSSVYTVVPIYLGEISEDDIRGFVCSLMMTFETAGELISYCVLPYTSIFLGAMIAVGTTVWVALFIIGWLPESPYYLLLVRKRAKAEKCLMKLRSDTKEGVRNELEFMESMIEEYRDYDYGICDLFRIKAARRAEIITLGLTIFQHFSGIIPVMMYSQNIFNETGTSIPPEICTIILAILQFLVSFIAPNLVDKLGRRWMLLVSAILMSGANACLGTFFYLKAQKVDMTIYIWVPVGCFMIFLIGYLIGFGPLIWTIMGEIFSPQAKAKAFLLGVGFWWAMAFALSKSFHIVAEKIGMAGCFWLFSGFCGVSIIFVFSCVIETQNKNLYEIQLLLDE